MPHKGIYYVGQFEVKKRIEFISTAFKMFIFLAYSALSKYFDLRLKIGFILNTKYAGYQEKCRTI
jgi:hypothetical protein